MDKAGDGGSAFGRTVRGLVTQLWRGNIDMFNFIYTLSSSIEYSYRRAWVEGAETCGIKPEDFTEEEIDTLNTIIAEDISHIDGFMSAVITGSKNNHGLLSSLLNRAEMWSIRYAFVRDRAKAMACGNQKLKWVYGDTEHCDDCLKLNDRVYRAKTWEKWEIYPKSPGLQCGGFKCKCEFEETDDPCTPGRPPSLVGKEIHVHTRGAIWAT
jgi:hypothetical protein